LKNVGSMAVSIIIPAVLNLLLLMVVSRLLLNQGMNQYNVALNYVAMFALSSDLGITSVLIREVSRKRSRLEDLFSSFLALRLSGTILMGLIAILIVRFLPYDPVVVGYIYLAVISQVIFQAAQSFNGVFQSVERMEYIALGTAVQSGAFFILGLWFVRVMGLGVAGLIYSGMISNLLLLCVYALPASRLVRRVHPPGLSFTTIRFLVLAAIPFGVFAILNILQTYTVRILLSFLCYDQVADYTMIYVFVTVIAFAMSAYMSSVFPLFSRMRAGGSANIRYACRLSFRYLFALMAPLCIGGFLLADRIVFTLYGADFRAAIPVLRVLIFMLVFMVINTVGLPLINATYRERGSLIGGTVCLGFNIFLNLALIPSMGAVGAGIATVLTVMLGAGITWYLIRDQLEGIDLAGMIVKPAAAVAVMGLCVWLAPLNNLLLSVLAGGLVYLLTFVVIGGISKEDVGLIKRIAFAGWK